MPLLFSYFSKSSIYAKIFVILFLRKEKSRRRSQRLWRTNRLKGIFSSMDAVSATRASMPQERPYLLRLLSGFPLFDSFFIHNVNTKIHQPQTDYTNSNTHWQGQIFEEITGQTSREDVFPQIPIYFLTYYDQRT